MPGFVEGLWLGCLGCVFEVLSIDPEEVELALAAHSGVLKRLDDGEIGVVKGNVFSDQDNRDLLKGSRNGSSELVPLSPSALAAGNEVLGLWHSIELQDV